MSQFAVTNEYEHESESNTFVPAQQTPGWVVHFPASKEDDLEELNLVVVGWQHRTLRRTRPDMAPGQGYTIETEVMPVVATGEGPMPMPLLDALVIYERDDFSLGELRERQPLHSITGKMHYR